MVVKESFGSFGAQVYLAKDEEELLEIVKNIGTSILVHSNMVLK